MSEGKTMGGNMVVKKSNYSKEFKAKVGLEALKGILTIAEISSKYKVHSTQINRWKKILQTKVSELFSNNADKINKGYERELSELYEQIGKLKVENDFLKKTQFCT